MFLTLLCRAFEVRVPRPNSSVEQRLQVYRLLMDRASAP
jgi:hypothetical protein